MQDVNAYLEEISRYQMDGNYGKVYELFATMQSDFSDHLESWLNEIEAYVSECERVSRIVNNPLGHSSDEYYFGTICVENLKHDYVKSLELCQDPTEISRIINVWEKFWVDAAGNVESGKWTFDIDSPESLESFRGISVRFDKMIEEGLNNAKWMKDNSIIFIPDAKTLDDTDCLWCVYNQEHYIYFALGRVIIRCDDYSDNTRALRQHYSQIILDESISPMTEEIKKRLKKSIKKKIRQLKKKNMCPYCSSPLRGIIVKRCIFCKKVW